MTEVATDQPPAEPAAEPSPSDVPVYAWAPVEPAPRKRHLGLWLGIPGSVLAVAAVAASLVLIAPGTAVAGVTVGGMTASGAAGALESRLAATEVVLATPAGRITLTGAEAGATIDAETLAAQAHAQHPLWNVSQWNAEPLSAEVSIDPAAVEKALRRADPTSYVAPTDAAVSYDPAAASYLVSAAERGQGLDLDAVRRGIEASFNAGGDGTTFVVDVQRVPVDAGITTAEAEQAAATLNHMLDVGGFYVGAERTVPIERATLASWLTVGESGGALTLRADAAAIGVAVAALPAQVDRAPVDATVVTNSDGDVLADGAAGVVGRTLTGASSIATAFAARLAAGDAAYPLAVDETAPGQTTLQRSIEVNLSQQRLYLHENGAVVDTWLISSGAPGFETHTGDYRIGWKTEVQTMRGYNGDGSMYETPNVKWVAYFNGDEALHGVYWHDNFGYQMSHGCVGMPEYRAQQVYEWAPEGVDVWVHY